MSENPFTDGQQFSSARLNSMYQAHQNRGVLNGLDVTTSTNSFDVDVATGEIYKDRIPTTISATTLTHATSDAEDRIDLITASDTGSVSITQGSPAATSGQPVAPDIPAGDVLVSLVYVRGGSTEILTGDILNDYRVDYQRNTPEGTIQMWSGATTTVPDGWTLCDGTEGTPDLRDRFIAGAGGQYSADATGGADSVTLSESEMPSHSHVLSPAADFSDFDALNRSGDFDVGIQQASTTATTNAAGGDQAHENRPPFYALAYIQKL